MNKLKTLPLIASLLMIPYSASAQVSGSNGLQSFFSGISGKSGLTAGLTSALTILPPLSSLSALPIVSSLPPLAGLSGLPVIGGLFAGVANPLPEAISLLGEVNVLSGQLYTITPIALFP